MRVGWDKWIKKFGKFFPSVGEIYVDKNKRVWKVTFVYNHCLNEVELEPFSKKDFPSELSYGK